MKLKKQIIIGIFMILMVLSIPVISKAGFESKADGDAWVNVTISQAYDICYGLRDKTSTLGNTESNVDPHLTLNKDWGAVAYLGLSQYGAVRSKEGETTKDGSHTTTTGNDTGVMDFGKMYEWTSSLVEVGTVSYHPEYRESLTKNKETKYVEKVPKDANTNVSNSKGMAVAETWNWYGSQTGGSWYVNYGIFLRRYVMGAVGNINGTVIAYAGGGQEDVTFRPTIWN